MPKSYVVTRNSISKIDLAPSSEAAEILQNVQTLINIEKGSIPLDREMGISERVIDMPIVQAEGKYSNEIFKNIRKYEPRATIGNITFKADINGKLQPRIEVII